jgi:phosphatidate cytidylyltransferase
MSNILQRLLLFFLGIPLVVGVIVFLPQFDHGAAVALILVFMVGCSLELCRFFQAKGIVASPAAFVLLGAGIPAGAYFGELLGGRSEMTGAFLGIILAAGTCLIAVLAKFAFVKAESIPEVLPQANALAFAAAYPGLFGAFVVLIASEPRRATESLLCFCILAFSNDSLAWLVGMTLGKRRGIVAVSPNKSLAGFIGGMVGSIGMAFACAALFPKELVAPWWAILLFGAAVGAAVIVGDLFESALKRSAAIKDSGSAVPGRGGFLDTFDSLLFAAPLYYGLSLLLGFFR